MGLPCQSATRPAALADADGRVMSAHPEIVDPVLRHSAALRVAFLITGGLGVAAYLYRELFARFVIPIYDYVVSDVRCPTGTAIEVSREPQGTPLSFERVQFIFPALAGEGGGETASVLGCDRTSERRLDVSIKAARDYTRHLP
jgi:hypothetical protein